MTSKPHGELEPGLPGANVLLAHRQLREDSVRCEQLFNAYWWRSRCWDGLLVVCLCAATWSWKITSRLLTERIRPPGEDMCLSHDYHMEQFINAQDFYFIALKAVVVFGLVMAIQSIKEGWVCAIRTSKLRFLRLEYQVALRCVSHATEHELQQTIERHEDPWSLLGRQVETVREQLRTRLVEVNRELPC